MTTMKRMMVNGLPSAGEVELPNGKKVPLPSVEVNVTLQTSYNGRIMSPSEVIARLTVERNYFMALAGTNNGLLGDAKEELAKLRAEISELKGPNAEGETNQSADSDGSEGPHEVP